MAHDHERRLDRLGRSEQANRLSRQPALSSANGMIARPFARCYRSAYERLFGHHRRKELPGGRGRGPRCCHAQFGCRSSRANRTDRCTGSAWPSSRRNSDPTENSWCMLQAECPQTTQTGGSRVQWCELPHPTLYTDSNRPRSIFRFSGVNHYSAESGGHRLRPRGRQDIGSGDDRLPVHSGRHPEGHRGTTLATAHAGAARLSIEGPGSNPAPCPRNPPARQPCPAHPGRVRILLLQQDQARPMRWDRTGARLVRSVAAAPVDHVAQLLAVEQRAQVVAEQLYCAMAVIVAGARHVRRDDHARVLP